MKIGSTNLKMAVSDWWALLKHSIIEAAAMGMASVGTVVVAHCSDSTATGIIVGGVLSIAIKLLHLWGSDTTINVRK